VDQCVDNLEWQRYASTGISGMESDQGPTSGKTATRPLLPNPNKASTAERFRAAGCQRRGVQCKCRETSGNTSITFTASTMRTRHSKALSRRTVADKRIREAGNQQNAVYEALSNRKHQHLLGALFRRGDMALLPVTKSAHFRRRQSGRLIANGLTFGSTQDPRGELVRRIPVVQLASGADTGISSGRVSRQRAWAMSARTAGLSKQQGRGGGGGGGGQRCDRVLIGWIKHFGGP